MKGLLMFFISPCSIWLASFTDVSCLFCGFNLFLWECLNFSYVNVSMRLSLEQGTSIDFCNSLSLLFADCTVVPFWISGNLND